MSEPGQRAMTARRAAERADALQADYFLRVLRAQRAEVAAEAASQANRLQRLIGTEHRFESIGIRRAVRAKDAELRTLDRMIERLLRRFPGGSAG
jgi:glycerol-3-phosphate O-acyltransferase